MSCKEIQRGAFILSHKESNHVNGDIAALISPAAILKIPDLYMSIKGGGSKTAIFQEDTAWDPVTAAHQQFHFLFTATTVLEMMGHLEETTEAI